MLSLLALVLTPAPEAPEIDLEDVSIPTVFEMIEDLETDVSSPSETLDPQAEQQIIESLAAEIEAEREEAERRAAIEQAEQEAAERARQEQAEREAAAEAERRAAEEAERLRDDVPAQVVPEPWATLADCESGDWVDGGASFVPGSARWGWGGSDPIPPWGTSVHDGGLQFHPGTWDRYRDASHPARAYDATPAQQVAVAERVLASEGWGAWPTCSSKIGLR